MRNLKDLLGSNTQNWSTNPDDMKRLDDEFHFTFDPCPANPAFDGLTESWIKLTDRPRRVFVNPPHVQTKKWLLKGLEELPNCEVIVYLIPVRSETNYFQELVFGKANEVRFIRGKQRFIDQRHKEGDTYKLAPAPFPTCYVIYWSHTPYGEVSNHNIKEFTNWVVQQTPQSLNFYRRERSND